MKIPHPLKNLHFHLHFVKALEYCGNLESQEAMYRHFYG